MAKIQSFKKLIAEDFESKDRSLVSKLAYSINIFAEDVLSAFNNNLSIADNLNITQKSLTVAVNNSGTPTITTSLKTGLSHNCQGIQVIKAVNNSTPSHSPTGTPFITFSELNGTIRILKVTNLQAAEQYTLTLLLF